MRDFGYLLAAAGYEAAPELPEGIYEPSDGVYFATCCRCGRDGEIFCALSELPPTGYQHYCGGSPQCCL